MSSAYFNAVMAHSGYGVNGTNWISGNFLAMFSHCRPDNVNARAARNGGNGVDKQ